MESLQTVAYEQALTLAKQNRLSDALAVLFSAPLRSVRSDRLKALCLWRIGYFKQAGAYAEDLKEDVETYAIVYGKIKPLIEQKNYNVAEKVISTLPETVVRYQISGCLFCLSGLYKQGKAHLYHALALDLSNQKTIALLNAANDCGGGGIAQLLRHIAYKLRRG